MKGLIKSIIFLFFILTNNLFSQIPNLENRDKKKIKSQLLDTYYRSMSKWDISFKDLLENKAGAACIEWNKMSSTFLSNGIFDALGYSQNVPNKKASQIAAISGCNKMKQYYELEGKCECEVIVVNSNNKVIIPIKKIDIDKDFDKGIAFFKSEKYEEALEIFKKLSELGDSRSQYNFSFMHLKGYGVTQNFSLAYYWALSSKLYGESSPSELSDTFDYCINKGFLKFDQQINLTALKNESLKRINSENIYKYFENGIHPITFVINEDQKVLTLSTKEFIKNPIDAINFN